MGNPAAILSAEELGHGEPLAMSELMTTLGGVDRESGDRHPAPGTRRPSTISRVPGKDRRSGPAEVFVDSHRRRHRICDLQRLVTSKAGEHVSVVKAPNPRSPRTLIVRFTIGWTGRALCPATIVLAKAL